MPSSPKHAPTLSTDNGSSDYGSDFSTDEEELLNDLLARVAASNTTSSPAPSPSQAPTSSAAVTTTVVESVLEAVVEEKSSNSKATAVPDVEDYDPLHFTRVPKVLGRETWASKQRWQQQQRLQVHTTTWRRAQRPESVARDGSVPVIRMFLLDAE